MTVTSSTNRSVYDHPSTRVTIECEDETYVVYLKYDHVLTFYYDEKNNLMMAEQIPKEIK
jgi:hypothetical protein